MLLKMQIVKVEPENRSAVIRYFTDDFPDGTAYNLTFYGPVIPTGEALVDHLIAHAPLAWLALKSTIGRDGQPDMSSLAALVGEVMSREVVDPDSR